MNRVKHLYSQNTFIILSNGATFITKTANCHKKYNDQVTDIFNDSRWSTMKQEEAIDAYKGQQLRFRKRFNINTID